MQCLIFPFYHLKEIWTLRSVAVSLLMPSMSGIPAAVGPDQSNPTHRHLPLCPSSHMRLRPLFLHHLRLRRHQISHRTVGLFLHLRHPLKGRITQNRLDSPICGVDIHWRLLPYLNKTRRSNLFQFIYLFLQTSLFSQCPCKTNAKLTDRNGIY
jgi:hypothetical protein